MKSSTIQLLRFHFSFFLMPVYLFALSQIYEPNWSRAGLCFVILHLIVYPSSNGYNSYMDRDEGSIGGIRNPQQPTRELLYTTYVLDVVAVILGLFISKYFAIGIALYILASRMYSFRGIRLKKYPFAGYFTVVIFQGAVTFWLVYHAAHPLETLQVPVTGMVASSLLIGGFYPLTQIYQHEADKRDGVLTISALLGYRGTFIFTGIVYCLAFMALAYHFLSSLEYRQFGVLQIIMLPVIVYFFMWAVKVWRSQAAADFTNTMKMNILASSCANLSFLTLLIWRALE